MATTVLGSYLNALLTGESIDVGAASLKIVLVTADHTPDHSPTGDKFLSDIASANRVMETEAFSATVNGLDVDPDVDTVALIDPDNGLSSTQGWLYIDTGTETTSRLLMHNDANVSLTSDGTNDELSFDDPARMYSFSGTSA